MSQQQNERGEFPLALAPGTLVEQRDTLVLVLRSIAWSQQSVDDLIGVMNRAGLDGRYVILYLDADDQALVVRGGTS